MAAAPVGASPRRRGHETECPVLTRRHSERRGIGASRAARHRENLRDWRAVRALRYRRRALRAAPPRLHAPVREPRNK